jgi:sugar (pentulose or hexulose) kinase
MMSALAAGSVKPGSVTVSLAPQASVAVVGDEPLIDPLGGIGVVSDLTDRWLSVTKRVRAGGLLEEVRRHYGWSGVQLREAMMAASDGAEGLLLMPGSRQAGYRGTLYGINERNYRPENVARAALEALILELGEGLARMVELGVQARAVRMTGGGSGDAEVRQLVADILGIPVVPVSGEVSPAMGAALQAAWTFFHQSGEDITFEEITSYAVIPEENKRSEPQVARHKLYQAQLERRRALEDVLRGEEWPQGR